MKMKPKQLKDYIEYMKTEQLRLKHAIEACEFEIDQNKCPACRDRLTEDLEIMLEIAEEVTDLPETLQGLEEHLAEDEALNGWKGEDRYIEF